MKLKRKSVLTTPAHASAPINSPRPQDIAEIGEVNNCGLQSAVEFADPLGVVEDDAEAIAEMTFLEALERFLEDGEESLEAGFEMEVCVVAADAHALVIYARSKVVHA